MIKRTISFLLIFSFLWGDIAPAMDFLKEDTRLDSTKIPLISQKGGNRKKSFKGAATPSLYIKLRSLS